MARESKFQNLTVDFRQLRTLSINDRLDFLRSSDGASILPNFTPSQLNDLFPWYYRRSFTDIGQAFKAVSDRRNLSGGVSAEAAEPVSTTGLSPRAARDAAAAGVTTNARAPVSSTWQDRLRDRTGVNINEPSGGPAMERLKREIARGEGDYDSVNRGRAGDTPGGAARLLGRPLSDFTVGEIMDMQKGGAGRRQLFAVGKYQFTPPTLAEAVRWTGMDRNTKLDAAAQERLFDYTISEQKRPALAAYLSGKSNDRNAALRDLALEYASVPGPNGRGAYDRDRAGNMAYGGMERAERMLRILSEAREERITGQTSRPEATVEAPQLPSGLAPKLLEELNRMSPRQQQKFMTALDKIGGVEKMNELYAQNPDVADKAAATGSGFVHPVDAEIGSQFGPRRRPTAGASTDHRGVDYRASAGSSVRAASDGVVVSAGPAGGYGNMVEIDHGNGIRTRYAHLRGFDVKPGDRVTRGQTFAKSGGVPGEPGAGVTTGAHLHFEVLREGRQINPVEFYRENTLYAEPSGGARSTTQTVQNRPAEVQPSQPTAAPLSVPGVQAGETRRQTEQPQSQPQSQSQSQPPQQEAAAQQPQVQPSDGTMPELKVMATGGHMRTDATQLQAYGIDKGKLQRENMLVTDGSKPLFTMNSEEEMKFNPDTGKVSVNPSPRGLKADPEALKETIQSPTDAAQTTNTVREERAAGAVMPQPTMMTAGPSATPTNSYDTILNNTIQKMSPSFERAIARSRFANTGDAALGGHFDFGASNMA